jgi:hypothetical protein
MASPVTDWSDDSVRSQAIGVVSLVVATVLSFGAGIGSTLLYLQANKKVTSVVVPLIEAERGPTRVRPEGLDASGNPVARGIPSFSATSSALAMTPRGDDVPSIVPADESALNLRAQGIPATPDTDAPNGARVVAELTPEAVTTPTAAPAIAAGGPQFRLQLASFRSADSAGEEMNRVARAFASELSGLALSVERIDQGHRGIYFRVLSEPIAERDRAGETCTALAGRRAQCRVVAIQSRSAPP